MANIRSWTQIWPSFVRLCILNLVLDFKIIALADDSGSSGFAAENSCKNTNYQNFLPPPYQNISHMICTPVWHTYELRMTTPFEKQPILLAFGSPKSFLYDSKV
ncbi:Ferric-chelate reductase 1 [Sesbania bispinosa]|nr:Ferric-chelate reductase 1 [Sesbania bispinosa]